MLSEMDQALADEIERQNTFKQIKHSAVDGKLLSEENGQYIYQFTLTEPWEPQDDGQLTIATPTSQGIKCTTVTSIGTLLTIASEHSLPPEVLRRIDFYDDSTELLKRLKEALKHVDEGTAKLGSKSFGLLSSARNDYPGEVGSGAFHLRPKQEQAARWALGGEVTFIVGPPGTGKTSTLAVIALKHLQAGQTVLIASHTNIAIDNAIMKLCEMCKGTGDNALLAQGQVIRFGAVQKEELKKNDYYQEVYLPKVARFLGVELHTQYAQIKAEIDAIYQTMQFTLQKKQKEAEPYQAERQQLGTQIDRLQKELLLLEPEEEKHISFLQAKQRQQLDELQQITSEEKRISQELARTRAQIEEQKLSLAGAKQNEHALLMQLIEARTMGKIKRFFTGRKLEKLELEVAATSQTAYEIERSIADLQTRLDVQHRILTQCKQKKQASEAAFNDTYSQLSTPSEGVKKINSLKKRQQSHSKLLQEIDTLYLQNAQQHQQEYNNQAARRALLEEQLADIDKRLRAIEKSIVENARVVGTTLTKTYMNQTMAEKRFDTVIIDEVSMAPLPLVYVAASRADRSVTLIGDPQQLAPIFNAETPVAKKWLGKDLFEYRGISLDTAINGFKQSVLLNVQSRTHPDISVIANKYVYDNKLHDEFDMRRLKKIQPSVDHMLVLCDTHDGSPTATRPPNGRSRKNYYHALCSIALARQVLASVPEMKQNAERSIGIVTPYRPQAQLLQRLVAEAGLQNWVQAGTVHRFQGLEFDVVIFDTVESPGLAPGEYISGSRGSNSMRLINVAVTRPKQKLYIVANLPHIRSTLPEQSILRLAVEKASRSSILPSLDIVGTPFSTFMEQLQRQNPLANSALAVLNNALTDGSSGDVSKGMIEDVLILKPAGSSSRTYITNKDETQIKHFTEVTFYDAFKQDIQNARKSICIASPYLAEARLNNVLPLLIAQKNKGIGIEIFTRPLNESKDWDVRAVEKVRSVGLEPIYKTKMHEKVAIIDEKVLYHGTLNSLSHRDTTESILRITTPSIIRDVNESLRSDRQSGLQFMIDDNAFEQLQEIVVYLGELTTATKCACNEQLIPKLRNDKSGVFFGCWQFRESQDRSSENLSPIHFQNVAKVQNQVCRKCGSATSLYIQDKPQRVLLICDANCGEIGKITLKR